MCHISLLDSAQIEALESLPMRFRRDFERRTDNLSVRDRQGTLAAYTLTMEAAGKSGERVMEITASTVTEPPVALSEGIFRGGSFTASTASTGSRA